MTSALVTGAGGFIGRHLVSGLEADGWTVVASRGRADGDVASAATWAAFPRSDVVIHLAGLAFVPDSWNDPAGYVESNVVGTMHALEYCRRHGARMVFLSSYLYGRPASLPIAEDAEIQTPNPYALSKKLAEDACRFYAEHLGVGVAVLRPFNVYGPHQPERFVIPMIVRQAKAGGTIRVQDLEPRRDYVYVADVADAIRRAAARTASGFAVVNIGSGTSHSVREVVELVQREWGTTLPVESDGVTRPNEIMDTMADVSAAQRLLGWSPAWTLERGLADIRAHAG